MILASLGPRIPNTGLKILRCTMSASMDLAGLIPSSLPGAGVRRIHPLSSGRPISFTAGGRYPFVTSMGSTWKTPTPQRAPQGFLPRDPDARWLTEAGRGRGWLGLLASQKIHLPAVLHDEGPVEGPLERLDTLRIVVHDEKPGSGRLLPAEPHVGRPHVPLRRILDEGLE